MRLKVLIPLCAVTLGLAGCGNKGPLYMPAAKPTPAASASAPASASTVAAPTQH